MKKIFLLILIAFSFTLLSCTENNQARNFGGNQEILLPKNEVFLNATWKKNNLWIISYDTVKNTYQMREKSEFGLFEGKINFKSTL